MPTNIGNLSFGIDADTKGLRNVIRKLNEFKAVVDKTAKSQSDGAKKAAAALIKQESAIKRAISATLKLRQAQLKGGAPAGELAKTTNAVRTLTTQLTSGTLKTKEFTRATDQFAVKMNTARRSLTDLNKAASGKGVNKFATQLRNLESASVLAIGPLSGLGARIRSLGAIAGRSSLRLVGMFAAVTAGIVAFAKLSSAAVNAGKVFESSMARFEAASGSIEIARKQMSFVIKTAQTLGLRIDTSAKAFSRLSAAAKGTSLEGEGARKIFLAVSKAAAALRLGAGEVEGTFRAIEQMMSKGTVQAEELRGQLGERLPGAFRLAAASMSMTTAELGKALKNSEVLAEVFLPKLAEALERTFAAKALDNINSFQGAMNNLSNEGLLFAQAFNKAANVTGIFIGAVKTLSGAIRFLREQLNNIIAVLGGVLVGFAVLGGPTLLAGLLKVGGAIRAMAISMVGLNVALAQNPLIAMVGLFKRFAVAIGVAVAAFIGFKIALDATTDAVQLTDDALDELLKEEERVAALGNKFKQLTRSIKEARMQTKVYEEVLGFMDRFAIEDIDRLIMRFKILGEVQNMGQDILEALAKSFDIATGVTRKQLIEKVAEALFLVFDNAVLAKAALDTVVLTDNALRDSTDQLDMLKLRLDALQEGQTAVDFFDDVTTAVLELQKSFIGTTVSVAEQTRRMAELEAVIIATLAAELNLDAVEKARRASLRKTDAANKKLTKGLERAVDQINILRAHNKALAEGPDSFEYFTKVESKVLKFEAALRKVTDNMALIRELSKLFRAELDEIFLATNRFARAADSMASLIIQGFEDIIVKGGSVRDMLHDLAKALLRVALRALFLDKLQASLSGLFKGSGAVAPAIIPPPPVPAARGLTFRVPGSGGSDKVPISLLAKPGEIVSVRRPDQLTGGGGMGGGAGVVVTMTNIFEGGISDPAMLIPILEENNRKLKGEILDGIDRGTFA